MRDYWSIIKQEDLPTNLIPYQNFDEELNLLIITNTLLGWKVEIDRFKSNRQTIYYVQFNKYKTNVQIVIRYNDDETTFVSMHFNSSGNFKVNTLNYNINYHEQTSNGIQKILSYVSEILDSAY